MKLRVGVVADSNNRARNQLCRREKVVVRWWWYFRGAEWADVYNRALKSSVRTLLHHFVGGVGEDLSDAAGSSPSNDMIRASSGALELGMGRGYINFDAVVNGEMGRGAEFIQTFLCCLRHEGFVRGRETMEGGDGDAQCGDEGLR